MESTSQKVPKRPFGQAFPVTVPFSPARPWPLPNPPLQLGRKGKKKKRGTQSLPDFTETKMVVIMKRKPDHHNVNKAFGFSYGKPRNYWPSLS